MLKIALCDDDPSISVFLKELLERNAALMPEAFHICTFTEGTALLAALPFDVIFLDIELGDTTGIRAAEEIRAENENTVLVFVSAHESYCKELFCFDTTAFLGKPIEEEAVRELLPRIGKRLKSPQKTFSYRVNARVYRLSVADILFFETKARRIEVVTRQKRDLFYGKLDEVEASLKHPGFVRIHHSFLVNLDNVERFSNTALIMPGGYTLSIAQRKQGEIYQKIMDYYAAMGSNIGMDNDAS
jgi:DNA-binding LytR/AlgR family response regulator